MRSSKKPVDNRRQVFLALSSSIESQLRDAFLDRFDDGKETQSSLAAKLGVNKSVVNRRLRGESNMTVKTLADMVWALEQCIEVKVFDPHKDVSNRGKIVPIVEAVAVAESSSRTIANLGSGESAKNNEPTTDSRIRVIKHQNREPMSVQP